VPALAASDARARSLGVITVPPDYATHCGAAVEKQAEALVAVADAVVVVWDAPLTSATSRGEARTPPAPSHPGHAAGAPAAQDYLS
jgi:hypothetical protein